MNRGSSPSLRKIARISRKLNVGSVKLEVYKIVVCIDLVMNACDWLKLKIQLQDFVQVTQTPRIHFQFDHGRRERSGPAVSTQLFSTSRGLHRAQSCDKRCAPEGMRRVTRFLLAGNLLLGAVFFGACETVPQGIQQARLEMAQNISAEPPGITLSDGVITNPITSSGATFGDRANRGAPQNW